MSTLLLAIENLLRIVIDLWGRMVMEWKHLSIMLYIQFLVRQAYIMSSLKSEEYDRIFL